MKTLKIMMPFMIAITMLFATSCSKDEGFEGKKDIKGQVTYPGGVAPGAIITVAFGESGPTDKVDFTTVADAEGKYSISGLEKGDYFMDASYTDPRGFVFESPGVKVEIKNTKDELTVNFDLQ